MSCTAHTLPGDKERFLASGFDAFAGKPFTEEGLLATLQALLETPENLRLAA